MTSTNTGIEKDEIPMQSKKAVVIIGRFSPPTIGHYHLVDKAKKIFKREKLSGIVVAVVAGTNTSENKKKNPLSAARRIYYMKASGRCNGIRFVTGTNAVDALFKVREAGYEPIWLVTGSDRGKSYEEILDRYFLNDDDEPIEHHTVTVDRDSGDDDSSGVSATIARAAAENDMFDEFKSMVDLNDELAKKMFNEIRKSMGDEDADI